jgi:predicted ATPase
MRAKCTFDSRSRSTVGRARERSSLRASTSLARLWRDQGKRTEVRNLLAPIYGWFIEGFDTPDLKEGERFAGLVIFDDFRLWPFCDVARNSRLVGIWVDCRYLQGAVP